MENTDCPFCNRANGREIILETKDCFAIYDAYPVSKGHALIIPDKHCANYFDLTTEEQLNCFLLVNEVKLRLQELYKPDGFNIGININEAAGQTVGHVHIHLIPRYKGDVEEPKGGVRRVVPKYRDY